MARSPWLSRYAPRWDDLAVALDRFLGRFPQRGRRLCGPALGVQLVQLDAQGDPRDAGAEGWPEWINIPSKVGQVAAMRVLARERRPADQRSRTLIAAVCPGLIDTAASRPWFDDMRGAQTPTEAAAHLLTLALDPVRPATYGELVQFGRVRPWL